MTAPARRLSDSATVAPRLRPPLDAGAAASLFHPISSSNLLEPP
eukprot:CAMPEP_0194340956 /NCGR_PEP_ID=MMETSP0171-20130528/88076_1 /TAXON_ID=218684 /ORGANISM="Corethron pennatum, Strain L29A3" /LENGTH=43 /DNA_ID= /DNA_START= /DNA_END= /DNA_ORIENTATION=